VHAKKLLLLLVLLLKQHNNTTRSSHYYYFFLLCCFLFWILCVEFQMPLLLAYYVARLLRLRYSNNKNNNNKQRTSTGRQQQQKQPQREKNVFIFICRVLCASAAHPFDALSRHAITARPDCHASLCLTSHNSTQICNFIVWFKCVAAVAVCRILKAMSPCVCQEVCVCILRRQQRIVA